MTPLGWGILESFFKRERWTAYVKRGDVVVGACGHKHRSIEKAQACAALMLTATELTGEAHQCR